ncbi:hypothetical protein [Pseudescherichia vulneris]|uniref:hypothetical protein n=1 Tax=Pseudescherichia vulneris TaxID=566 RepID=UPI0028AF736E|nr:hypothetical protein [Pseudescherichia vulneris]
MKERGMIFNAEMVRALLDGRKTQTRRIMKVQLSSGVRTSPFVKSGFEDGHGKEICCPFGAVGDRIWVREAFATLEPGSYEPVKPCDGYAQVVRYAASDRLANSDRDVRGFNWRPSIHMPRWASRLTLEITNVGVQRLQSISQNDAAREGLVRLPASGRYCINQGDQYFGSASHDAREVFSWLWSSIYGDDSWNANPWVWVIEFRRVEGGAA